MRIAHLTLALLVPAFASIGAGAGCQSSDVSRSIGARCDLSSDCDDRCLQPGTEYPGGFCSLTCDSDAACPGDAHCIEDQGGVCLFACDADPTCVFLGDGWTCQPASAHGGSGQVTVCRGS